MKSELQSYQKLTHLQTVCLKQNIPFVSYRLPSESDIFTLVQHQSFPEKFNSLENLNSESGFIIAPFVPSDNHSTYFLVPDCICESNEIDDFLIHKISEISRFKSIDKPIHTNLKSTTSFEFTSNVSKAVEAMKKKDFQKVVLSKIRIEELAEGFRPEDFFLKLCNNYPGAMVYLIQIPGVGCWMGATPEPLLTVENNLVKTVSLAGTQVATNIELELYSWSEKEIEEQGIVTGFVEDTLHSLEVKNLSKIGPINSQAGQLIHLKTSFKFPEKELQNKLGAFIQTLHPTPSVGGLPKKEACEFIFKNEQHDRSYYTGYLGPVNINKKSNIFVNLRCLQLFDKHFVLYSGAGITTSSVPEREWEETDNKMLTMLNAMNN